MFGMFEKKHTAFDLGYSLGDEAISYTEPVYNGLMSFVKSWNLTGFDRQAILANPYYAHMISIYAAVAAFEFSMFQMKKTHVDTDEVRRGFHMRLQELGSELEVRFRRRYQ